MEKEPISETIRDSVNIIDELKKELARMEERGGKNRNDPKFLILKKVIEKIESENEKFDKIWRELSNTEKHAIITRLENTAYFIRIEEKNPQKAKKFVDEIVRPLSEELYGLLKNEDGYNKVNIGEKFRLEEELNK